MQYEVTFDVSCLREPIGKTGKTMLEFKRQIQPTDSVWTSKSILHREHGTHHARKINQYGETSVVR